ncbi:MAG TPA: beta-N-acetylglucosaminidase domain-containing protein [Myxococcota bacterium]|nr:beta-N-acetylglucosaminidase domain-containing protein [Myxococcota bacterium]
MSGFTLRGIVEGYYGPPYSAEDRLWWVERLARWGMNAYCYAPKDDPLQRAEWRTPYAEDALREFARLIEAGAKQGVEVGFSVSPGLSMVYSSPEDRRLLEAKFRAFQAMGSRLFMLAFDDVPSHLAHDSDRRAFASLADAHVAVAHDLRDALGGDATVLLGPTDYVGAEPTDYLETMGASLDPAIPAFWTGRTVCSPEVRSDEAALRAATLRRRLVLWDNVPVSDGPMRPLLHLGPYARREPGLVAHVSGVLLNTMEHARASAVAVHTAAAWLRDPERYDAEAAWRAALDELGAGAPAAFAEFAAAHRFSPIHPDDRDPELEGAISSLRDELGHGRDGHALLAELRRSLERRAGCAERLRRDLADRALARELEPWIASHHAETQRMLGAVSLLETVLGPARRLHRVFAFFGFETRLAREKLSPDRVSYGPRRAVYPQLASLRDDEAGFGRDPALFLDRNLGDELVRLAERAAFARLGGRPG